MKYFVDFSQLLHYPCGIAVYIISLYREMLKLVPGLQITTGQNSLHISGRAGLLEKAQRLISPGIKGDYHCFPGSVSLNRHPILQTLFGVNSKHYEIIHFPGNFCPTSIYLKDWSKAVLTIHDMHPFRKEASLLNDSPWLREFRQSLPKQAQKAAAIVTVSQFSKNDIMHFLHIPEEKITVIPPAIQWSAPDMESPLFPLSGIHPAIVSQRYFLAVGALIPYKNYQGLIAAWNKYRLSSSYGNEKLVIVGASVSASIAALVKGTPGVIHLTSLPSRDLYALYRNACGFFALSYLEGFGIPLLEAMTCGCPACYATGNSMTEIGRDAAFSVFPDDHDAAAALFPVMKNRSPDLLARIRKQEMLARQYSWKNAARQHLTLFQSI